MLVLRRKAGEAIVLNGVITIYVLAVEGERVKLGISAPPEVVIVRSELLDTPSGGPMGGPGGPMAGPMSGPLGGRPPAPPLDGAPDFGRGPRGPERPYREPEPPARPGDSTGGLGPKGPDQSGSFGAPARYTPRRRYDNYGDDSDNTPVPGPHDVTRYR